MMGSVLIVLAVLYNQGEDRNLLQLLGSELEELC